MLSTGIYWAQIRESHPLDLCDLFEKKKHILEIKLWSVIVQVKQKTLKGYTFKHHKTRSMDIQNIINENDLGVSRWFWERSKCIL